MAEQIHTVFSATPFDPPNSITSFSKYATPKFCRSSGMVQINFHTFDR